MNCRVVKITVAFFAVVLFSSVSIYAQSQSGHMVDVKIYFHYDKTHVDPTYMSNKQSLCLIDSLLNDSVYLSTLGKIEILAQSSTEGSISYNERLSERRRLSLEEYFTTNYPQVDSSLWSFKSVAENWDLFHQHLEEDPNLPDRERILAISGSDRNADGKEWLLKSMNEGRSWRYIADNILPTHRFGASVLFTPLILYPMAQPAIIVTPQSIGPLDIPYCALVVQEPKLIFALKTNLVLDMLSVINISAEIPIGDRWSVVGEVVHPWWRSWSSNFTMQIKSYHAEVKYWLGDRATQAQLQGWSVGLYGGAGIYDVQLFSEDGVQGDFFDVGVQLSYSHPINRSKRLYLEYMLGIGYISTDYNDYYMAYDTKEFGDIKVIPYPWMNDKFSGVLPTRLGVSLAWHIFSKSKGVKR